jgi:hypothetical protein
VHEASKIELKSMFVSIKICLPAWRQLRPLIRKGIAGKLNAFKVERKHCVYGLWNPSLREPR